ncbi:carbohydrate kinase family protein [Ignavibacterium album]|uniref:carbohydrate kinase family protein n=1 Tax=Ignavibacterium album TaxID=591197 RepID=UPI0026EAEE21|nr:carbohydrate kinase family protein [Ignavibacterium album]
MKILLIGHSVFDTVSLSEKDVSSPGGIFYSAQQLLKISSPEDELFICTQIDDYTKEYFLPVYSGFNNDFIEKVDAIPSVKLFPDNKTERKEVYLNYPSKLNLSKINFSDFNYIMINMITGTDISPDDLKFIRLQTSALIYFDVHTLSRPMNQSGERIFTTLKNYEEWIRNIDIIQANENEFATLGSFKSETERVNKLFELGVKIILLTKGSNGAKAYFKRSGEVLSYFISSKKIKTINTVGCGDTFGATFFYNYIRTKNVYKSLSFAVIKTEKFLNERIR